MGELGDRRRHGRREQQCLPFALAGGDDLPHVVDEAHVEHAVPLVENEDRDFVEPDMALTAKVEQASRCRDQDFNARLQCLDLVVLVDTSENDGSTERQPSAIGPETLADLAGKFARRRKNQGMWCALYSRQILMQQTLQGGKRECGGLARPCLRNSEQILTFI